MCNMLRYKARLDQAYAKWEFSQVRIVPKFRYRVPPSEAAPVVTVRNGKPQLTMQNFGFATKKGRQMMARGETVAKLPMFREAFKKQRCLILAHGFYDSEDLGKSHHKQPWHMHLKTDEVMGFAGLWEQRGNEENFTIVSAPANSVVSRVIDRMPVILPEDLWVPWLDPEATQEELQAMLTPYPAEMMEAYPVTRRVNQKGFDGPECIEPIVPDQGDLGLL
jgi:putative SOS response-associated peptidase YedK